MGASGTGIFENDDAMDFVGGLADHPENADTVLREALETAAHMDDYLDAPEGAEALAAAAIVSAAVGHASPVEPPDLLERQMRRICRKVPRGLAPLAVEAIDRVLGDQSELRELWADADSLDEWRAHAVAVRHHLASA
jgi:hypothetical protein